MIEPITDKSVFIAAFRHFSTYSLLICRKKQQTLIFPIHQNYNQFIQEAKMGFSDVYRSVLKDYPDVLTVEEMSRALSISTKTGYKLIRENKIESLKVGRSYRIPKAHLLSYMRLVMKSSPVS